MLALEERAAAFLGQEEAVYLPTATMANQIALAILGERGTELIVEETAHIMVSELGGAAMHSGLQTRGLPGYRGVLSPEQMRDGGAALRRLPHPARLDRRAREHAQQRRRDASGRSRRCAASSTSARELGLAVHLDGARLANAAVASGVPGGGDRRPVRHGHALPLEGPRRAARRGDRGLAELMARARVEKHRFGGAMRQAGIVAAAGLYALEHNVDRLADDHARARRLAEGWADARRAGRPDLVETNFVQVDVGDARAHARPRRSRGSPTAGVGLSATVEPGVIRAVTHLDIDDDDVERAIELVPRALGIAVARLSRAPGRPLRLGRDARPLRVGRRAARGRARGRARGARARGGGGRVHARGSRPSGCRRSSPTARPSASTTRPSCARCSATSRDEELDRFLDAEHAAWRPARALVGSAHALLETLRDRKLRLARRRQHVARARAARAPRARGARRRRARRPRSSSRARSASASPRPAIFERALAELGLDPLEALFVGDRAASTTSRARPPSG